jgi:predicted secreted Zn-dependent protease
MKQPAMNPMILSVTALLVAASLTVDDPATASEPAPASPRLVEAVGQVGPVAPGGVPEPILLGYAVEGTSSRAIRASINDRRPAEEANGARHDARTRWSYRPRWQVRPDGRCDPGTATVTLSLTMILPDLTTRDSLSTREKAEWDAYFTALVTHERNHGRIAVAGQERMQAAMRASPDCDAIRGAVRAALTEVTEASDTYDSQTDHGRREGAVYPRPDS